MENIDDIELVNFKASCTMVLPSLREEDFQLITPLLFQKSYAKGELILQENEICDKIFFLNKGFVRMYYIDKTGNEINYRFTDTAHFFVDFQSFITKKPSRFYWQAMQDAEIISISYTAVQEVYIKSNTWNLFGRLIAEQVYLQLNERVEMLLFMQPEERYIQMLEKYPGVINQVSQRHIASFLGIQPETLSRIRKRLVKL